MTPSRSRGKDLAALGRHRRATSERALAMTRAMPWSPQTVRAQGTRRLYAIDTRPLAEVDAWLEQFRRFWGPLE
jgi:hypothetical protein